MALNIPWGTDCSTQDCANTVSHLQSPAVIHLWLPGRVTTRVSAHPRPGLWACVCWLTSPSSHCLLTVGISLIITDTSSSLKLMCLTHRVRGKYQKGNLSRHICRMCKSSTEMRNLASLSGNDDSNFFSSHAFYLFSRDTTSYFKTFPHWISVGNVNTIQDSATAFSRQKHLLSHVSTGQSPHGEAFVGRACSLTWAG